MNSQDIILDNIKTRRSIRKFIDKDIEQDKLDTVFEAARWAPSNCNKQLWKIVVIKDNKIKQRLVDEAGSSTLILKSPVVLCIIHYNDVFLEAYQTSSAVTQNILLMATELNIGSLWLNSKGNVDKIKLILDIPDKYIVSNFILLGYYDNSRKRRPPKRKPLANLIMEDKFIINNDELNWSHDPAQWSYSKLKNYQEYICRKTELGTCQDIIDKNEINIVKKISENYSENHLDFFPYDGHILKYLENPNITIVETSIETASYTKASLSREDIKVKLFHELIKEDGKIFGSISINFRLERLPYETRKNLFAFVNKSLANDGTFYIVSRTNNIFYNIFYKLFVKLLGDNISKTAIFSFFGPYKPLDINETEKMLNQYSFIIEKKRYFTIPPIFETIAKLMYQHKKSKGGNFIHRVDKETFLSKLFKNITKFQVMINFHFFGSIVVFDIKKKD